jgi:hypothetical protein
MTNAVVRWGRRHPRTLSASAFGIATALVMHLAWIRGAAAVGLVPVLTLAAGFAHALAGAITGPRLLDTRRTRSAAAAGLIGGGTSLIALAIFAPLFAMFLFATDLRAAGPLSYVAMPFFIALFAFLAAGWALFVVSVVVGSVLYLVAAHPDANVTEPRPKTL